jgi:hypothetical protein
MGVEAHLVVCSAFVGTRLQVNSPLRGEPDLRLPSVLKAGSEGGAQPLSALPGQDGQSQRSAFVATHLPLA